jgi:hypothetical protein
VENFLLIWTIISPLYHSYPASLIERVIVSYEAQQNNRVHPSTSWQKIFKLYCRTREEVPGRGRVSSSHLPAWKHQPAFAAPRRCRSPGIRPHRLTVVACNMLAPHMSPSICRPSSETLSHRSQGRPSPPDQCPANPDLPCLAIYSVELKVEVGH